MKGKIQRTDPYSAESEAGAGLRLLTGIILILFPVCFFLFRLTDPTYGRWIFLTVPLLAAGALADQRKALLPWAVYVVGFLGFAELRMTSAETLFPARFEYVIALERAVCGGLIPTLDLQAAFFRQGQVSWLDVLAIGTHASYFIVPHALAVLLLLLKAPHSSRYVYALIAMSWAAMTFSFLVPTAPPWLAAQRGFLGPAFRVVQEVLTIVSPEIFQAGNQMVGENEVAAMPSVHTATACLVALSVSRYGRVVRSLGWIYAAAMIFSLVYLGEHYFVDGLVGLVFTLAFWRIFLFSEDPANGHRADIASGRPAA